MVQYVNSAVAFIALALYIDTHTHKMEMRSRKRFFVTLKPFLAVQQRAKRFHSLPPQRFNYCSTVSACL